MMNLNHEQSAHPYESPGLPTVPCDPALERLLDEALRSPAPPDNLADRIVLLTQSRLRPGLAWRAMRLGIVASVSAAAVVAAALTGVFLAGVVDRPQAELLALQAEIDAMFSVQVSQAPIDRQIDQLTLHIDAASDIALWDALRDAIDHELTQWETGERF